MQYLTQTELARRWRMSPRTLERWRSLGQGPSYLKIGHVLYPINNIEAFERERMYLQSTLKRRPASRPVLTKSQPSCDNAVSAQ
jgi:hypothetical protein